MAEQWDAYLGNVDNKVASFYVDLGLRDEAPMLTHPWVAFVRVKLLSPGENGLTQKEEFDVLEGIERALLGAFKSFNAIYAGRMTTDGYRLSVFYASERPDYQRILTPVGEKFPEYNFALVTDKQPDWHFYHCTLYPSPEEMQVLQNNHVMQALKYHGDTLEQPHEVRHWIYFADLEKRYQFIQSVLPFGYKSHWYENEEFAPRKYAVRLTRIDRLDPQTIDDTVLQLFRLANHHDGAYDCWETYVEPPAPVAAEPWWRKMLKRVRG